MSLRKSTAIKIFLSEIEGSEESGDEHDEILNQLEAVSAQLAQIEKEAEDEGPGPGAQYFNSIIHE